jgi:hypothetical protein
LHVRQTLAPRAGARPHPPPSADTEDQAPLDALKAWTRTDVFRGPVQIAVFLCVFMVFDAAVSCWCFFIGGGREGPGSLPQPRTRLSHFALTHSPARPQTQNFQWSGDWSRIGAISKDTEAALRPVTGAIAAVHAASAAVAWAAAAGRGASPVWPAAKAAAVGVLAALEAVWDER